MPVDTNYEWDVFVSYSHKGTVLDWVRNHFHPALEKCLTDEMPSRDPKVFVDYQQETGVPWPDNLKEAVLRSRCLVAVLSGPYFRSAWCSAEWKSMKRREEIVNEGIPRFSSRSVLVYPVRYWDGEPFPEYAKNPQYRDLVKFAYPNTSFSETPQYVEFYQEMRLIANEIAKRIDRAPGWQSDWPVELPDVASLREPALPRL